MRAFISCLALFSLRIFFRTIEVVGSEQIPLEGPVLFVLNHNNALIDPAFVLCLAPRRVSFLAKAPLFRMPVLGYLLRIMESVPVYRRQDEGSDTEQNRETFSVARRILANGGTIALFPEGVSHSDTRLKPLKTGAARIALGASPLSIVPAGLYYTSKATFRSSAVLCFGAALAVPQTALGPDGEPPAQSVRELTARIEQALKDVTLQADHAEGLALVSRAERIFRSPDSEDGFDQDKPLKEFELRKLLMQGYSTLRTRSPRLLEEMQSLLNRYEAALAASGIDPFELAPQRPGTRLLLSRLCGALLYSVAFTACVPFVVLGAVLHYPAYRLTGTIATHVARGEQDMLSTVKLLASMVLFPLTWILASVLTGAAWGALPACAALVAAPLLGWIAMVFVEKLDRIRGKARVLALAYSNPRAFGALLQERNAIRMKILEAESLLAERGQLDQRQPPIE